MGAGVRARADAWMGGGVMRCKPGDIAIVIRGWNLGRVVSVLSFDSAYTHEISGISGAWRCVSRDPLFAINGPSCKVLFPDSWLIPITPASESVTGARRERAGENSRA